MLLHNITQKSVMSNIAYWAVYLHPLGMPENLDTVLRATHTAIYTTWPVDAQLSEVQIRELIQQDVMQQPEVKAWGEPGNDFLRQGTYIGLEFYEHAVVQSIINDALGY